MAFADLLFDFFGYPVNCRVKVAFVILGKQVGPRMSRRMEQTELSFRDASMVVLKGDARVNNPLVVVVEFFQLVENMVFDGLGQCDVVRRKNQFHAFKMQSNSRKSQIFHNLAGIANLVPILLVLERIRIRVKR